MNFFSSPELKLRIQRFEKLMLSEAIRGNDQEFRRARLLLWVHVASAPVALFLFIMLIFTEPSLRNSTLPITILYVITLSSILSLRWFETALTPSILVALGVTPIVGLGMLASGGFDSSAAFFLGTTPLFFRFTGGKRGALVSACGLILAVTLVYYLELHESIPEQSIPESALSQYLFALWAVMNGLGMAFLYEFIMTSRIDDVQQELEQRKLVEHSLRESEAAKDVFLAYMSHEIRNPMASILASVDLLEMPEFEGKREHYMGVLKRSAHNLRDLLDHVLDFSKIESGGIDLQYCSFSLLSLVEELKQEFIIQANAKGLSFVCSPAEGVPDQVVSDPVRLRQILFNLLDNAVKFTDDGVVELSVRMTDAGVCFGVRDTGVGIAPDFQEKVFEPYRQLRSSSKRRRGLGLGLPICKQLVALLGGDLVLESSPDGSLFHFCVNFEEREVLPAPAILRRRVKPNMVLVVEDNEAYRFILGEMLELLGLNVVLVSNGEEGVLASREQEFDLIIMDLNMPVMDGFRASSRIREDEREQGLPPSKILAISGNQFKGLEDRCLKSGIDRLLSKPVSQALLSQTVRAMLSGTEGA